MKDSDELTEQQGQELERALSSASSIITKDYLSHLREYELLEPSLEITDINILRCGELFRLKKLVVDKEESFLDKLTTVVDVASSIDCTLATIIKSDGSQVEYYFGIMSKKARMDNKADQERRAADSVAFHGALAGNFVGSEIETVSESQAEALQESIFGPENKGCAAVSGVVALRDGEQKSLEGYVQGMENLVDALRGKTYTILMLADPVPPGELGVIRQGYEMVYTQLAAAAKGLVTFSESDTDSRSEGETESVTKAISHGISMTQSRSKAKGWNFGGSAGASVHGGVNFGIKAGVSANAGIYGGINRGTSQSEGEGKTEIRQESTQTGTSVTVITGKTAGKSYQFQFENRNIRSLLETIDKHMKRLDQCASYGAFDCAAYVLTKDRGDALAVASNYNALLRGRESGIQASHINVWYEEKQVEQLKDYLRAFSQPRFAIPQEIDGVDDLIITPASVVSGNELAVQVGLPKKSVPGITVLPMASFGRNSPTPPEEKALQLGQLCHMGQAEGSHPVILDRDSLSMHTFVTGSTGTGKSTAICTLLDRLCHIHAVDSETSHKSDPIHFLIIEPAKGEYKDAFGNIPGVQVYGTNPQKMELLRLNPFSFPADTLVLEHIDRLVEIFNACWPMYAAMPAVLKAAMEEAYKDCGWSLQTSKYLINEKELHFPTFRDVMAALPRVVDSKGFSNDTQGDYKGALLIRLESLTNGINGQVFCSGEEIPDEKLFDRNVIVDLSRVGSVETKSLLMGILVLKLQEHRMDQRANREIAINSGLRHVTVLEEAHNLLCRTTTEQNQEGANLRGKSVEMLTNAIAEMRTYGEGFIIADQAPGLLDIAAIRNTNTKIIFRLPEENDRQLAGKSAGLNGDQIDELSRLDTGVAAVYQSHWIEPMLCKIDFFEHGEPFAYEVPPPVEDTAQDKFFRWLLSGQRGERPQDAETLRRWIRELATGVYAKQALLCALEGETLSQQDLQNALYCAVKGKTLMAQLSRLPDAQSRTEYGRTRIQETLAVSVQVADKILDAVRHHVNAVRAAAVEEGHIK